MDPVQVMLFEIIESAPQVKHPSFAEEPGWRHVRRPIALDDDRIQDRPRKSMLIPINVQLSVLCEETDLGSTM